jgi:hypothetical protein
VNSWDAPAVWRLGPKENHLEPAPWCLMGNM